MLYPQQNDVRNKLDISGIWDFEIDPMIAVMTGKVKVDGDVAALLILQDL